MYTLFKYDDKVVGAYQNLDTHRIVFTFDPANTDYANFKLDITNGAELLDADGQVMSSEQVTEFLSTLP